VTRSGDKQSEPLPYRCDRHTSYWTSDWVRFYVPLDMQKTRHISYRSVITSEETNTTQIHTEHSSWRLRTWLCVNDWTPCMPTRTACGSHLWSEIRRGRRTAQSTSGLHVPLDTQQIIATRTFSDARV